MTDSSAWQPIETAPKDGTPFLACWMLHDREPLFGVVNWGPSDDEFSGSEIGWLENQSAVDGFTHWQPLPSPPEAE